LNVEAVYLKKKIFEGSFSMNAMENVLKKTNPVKERWENKN
jgi:hypothetical protein